MELRINLLIQTVFLSPNMHLLILTWYISILPTCLFSIPPIVFFSIPLYNMFIVYSLGVYFLFSTCLFWIPQMFIFYSPQVCFLFPRCLFSIPHMPIFYSPGLHWEATPTSARPSSNTLSTQISRTPQGKVLFEIGFFIWFIQCLIL